VLSVELVICTKYLTVLNVVLETESTATCVVADVVAVLEPFTAILLITYVPAVTSCPEASTDPLKVASLVTLSSSAVTKPEDVMAPDVMVPVTVIPVEVVASLAELS
jgi:hypothetical protein